jgi:Trm5-related predicted tRNA methylase|tara:strand:+ start:511 stop:702 length:192 start_codon:yes stop_codon:yes gene_type:complete
MKNRTVSVFHCPTALYEEVKVISEKEMISISAFCRMAVNSMVKDYRISKQSSNNYTQNYSKLD